MLSPLQSVRELENGDGVVGLRGKGESMNLRNENCIKGRDRRMFESVRETIRIMR